VADLERELHEAAIAVRQREAFEDSPDYKPSMWNGLALS
jgi:hypothetical protein